MGLEGLPGNRKEYEEEIEKPMLELSEQMRNSKTTEAMEMKRGEIADRDFDLGFWDLGVAIGVAE